MDITYAIARTFMYTLHPFSYAHAFSILKILLFIYFVTVSLDDRKCCMIQHYSFTEDHLNDTARWWLLRFARCLREFHRLTCWPNQDPYTQVNLKRKYIIHTLNHEIELVQVAYPPLFDVEFVGVTLSTTAVC